MAPLSPSILAIRNNPRVLKLPPYLSFICIVIGVVWLFLLPLNEYSRRTYISENALLPGQVHTYFGGSEHNIFRAYRHEVSQARDWSPHEVAWLMTTILSSQGLKTAHQPYSYTAGGHNISGTNAYGILQSPRADATEAIVLMAAFKDTAELDNSSGVALVLTLARYFKRWSLWSKDIIFVITSESVGGPQAWVSAYHDTHDPSSVGDLPLKSGALQGALVLDYPAGPGGHRYDKLHILYDGINGQLPNLDLVNTVTNVANNQVGMHIAFQGMVAHKDNYADRLQTLFHGMVTQGLGRATGPHSAFIPYHVDAITLQTVGEGWHDEISLGKTVEGGFRSLNNLLEHFHQSFFFYLLLEAKRFVSIGTYLPSAMLVAGNFTIMCIFLWIRSGKAEELKPVSFDTNDSAEEKRRETKDADKKPIAEKRQELHPVQHNGMVAVVPKHLLAVSERFLFTPVALVTFAHLAGVIPLYLLHSLSATTLTPTFITLTATLPILPYMLALTIGRLSTSKPITRQTLTLSSCFSLLLLSIFLSTLSTINFSLGLIVGLLASPLSFLLPDLSSPADLASRTTTQRKNVVSSLALSFLFAPTTLITLLTILVGQLANSSNGASITNTFSNPAPGPFPPPPPLEVGPLDALRSLLVQAATAWAVDGTWTAVVVWTVWWPAWFVGSVVGACAVLL